MGANIYSPRNSSKLVTPGSGSVPQLDQSDQSRVLPRQLSTGSTRGVQTVGYGNTKIDGSNNRITIGTPDGGTIGFGSIPGSTTNEFGFFTTDSNGNVIMKISATNGSMYMNDPTQGNINRLEIGLLPDGTYNLATSKPGEDLQEAFS